MGSIGRVVQNPLDNLFQPSTGTESVPKLSGPVDPALRPFHLFSWGGYREEAMTFTPPVALATWSTVDNGDGTHTATIGTDGSQPHGLIAGRPVVLKRSNGTSLGTVTPGSLPTTSSLVVTLNAAVVSETGTVESSNPRIATYTNPAAWGGVVSKGILASRPELEVVGGLAGLRSDGVRFLHTGATFSGPSTVLGMMMVFVLRHQLTSMVNRFVSVANFGQGTNTNASLRTAYNSATSMRFEGGLDGTNQTGGGISPLSSVQNLWTVVQVAYLPDSPTTARRYQRINQGSWTSGSSLTRNTTYQSYDWGASIFATVTGAAPHEVGAHVASLDCFAGDHRDDPDLFEWLEAMQPGPTYPTL